MTGNANGIPSEMTVLQAKLSAIRGQTVTTLK